MMVKVMDRVKVKKGFERSEGSYIVVGKLVRIWL